MDRFLNKIILGDCLEVICNINNEIDLVYIDPPFFTGKNFFVGKGESRELAYCDKWESLDCYLAWLRERIELIYTAMKDTGTIYVHCDWRTSHYIKVILDDIFGYENFRNEIIWHYDLGNAPRRDLKRKHDTIFRYAKSDNFIFNRLLIPSKNPDRYKLVDKGGRHYFIVQDSGKKIYLDDGKIEDDVWTYYKTNKLRVLNSMSNQRREFGYPTQKPEYLMQRIINASSKKNDLVADFFCGSGTFLVVARRMSRRWVGVDSSPIAWKIANERISKEIQMELI